MAIFIFLIFVVSVLLISFYFSKKTKSANGYFAAGGQIHWFVNGIAFGGDYLSAASFLGICGMIAVAGYDGFLYSIGYLAGWIVALFVVAEPLKRMGKYTFTDALDSKFNSRGIQLMAAISTLVVSIFYLIPQMVGAGVLVTPLLGLPHYMGVIMVGAIVITIVATAGMTSTTYVQFIKGGLLIVFSIVLIAAVCIRGLSTTSNDQKDIPISKVDGKIILTDDSYKIVSVKESSGMTFLKLKSFEGNGWWKKIEKNGSMFLAKAQNITKKSDGTIYVNGTLESKTNKLKLVGGLDSIEGEKDVKTGKIGVFDFLAKIGNKKTVVRRWKKEMIEDGGDKVTVIHPVLTPGNKFMRPGLKFKVEGTFFEKLDFISLMLALFLGTAALPHILIRYYTVPSQAAARKSTIVAIAAIGFFYILTLFLGLGAMVNGAINPMDSNMSGPLLAKSFGVVLFAIISAIAFATVLGTVSGLIVAASGAVAHDIMDRFMGLNMSESVKVRAGKIAAITVGIVAIILGIVFQGMNVSFLVGWAFAVAASANLPSIFMLLFWKKTTKRGITASIAIGALSAVGLILASPSMYLRYGWDPKDAIIPINNPGIIAIPLSFIVLIVVSLLTQKKEGREYAKN